MTKFRLKIDLSQFYDDERNLAYILVDPGWDEVICLQNHVKNLFDVPDVQFLTHDGIYIPPRESINIIKSNDFLRAIIPKTHKKKKKNKSNSTNGLNVLPGEETLILVNGDKRKCDDERLTCSTPNIRLKKKQKINPTEDIKSREIEASNIQALQNNTNNIVEELVNNSGKETFTNPKQIIEDTIKSRKRKRVKKNKKSNDNGEIGEKSNRLSSVPVPISSSTLRLSMPMSTPNHSTKHIHFDESLTLPDRDPPSVKRTMLRCALKKNSETREIPAEIVYDSPQQKKATIQIHEDIVLVPAHAIFEGGADQNDCSVIEVEDSLVKCHQDDSVDDELQDITVEKILPLSEELSGMPNIGDIIIFKMYRLSDALTPEISEYICGRCELIDTNNKTLNCLVLDGQEHIDENFPRLTPSDENGFKISEKSNCFLLFLNELLDKRVFRM